MYTQRFLLYTRYCRYIHTRIKPHVTHDTAVSSVYTQLYHMYTAVYLVPSTAPLPHSIYISMSRETLASNAPSLNLVLAITCRYSDTPTICNSFWGRIGITIFHIKNSMQPYISLLDKQTVQEFIQFHLFFFSFFPIFFSIFTFLQVPLRGVSTNLRRVIENCRIPYRHNFLLHSMVLGACWIDALTLTYCCCINHRWHQWYL